MNTICAENALSAEVGSKIRSNTTPVLGFLPFDSNLHE